MKVPIIILILISSVYSLTLINSCQTLNIAGETYQFSDSFNATTNDCLVVNNSSIVINGNGFYLNSNSFSEIAIRDNANFGVNISNLILTNYSTAINVNGTTNIVNLSSQNRSGKMQLIGGTQDVIISIHNSSIKNILASASVSIIGNGSDAIVTRSSLITIKNFEFDNITDNFFKEPIGIFVSPNSIVSSNHNISNITFSNSIMGVFINAQSQLTNLGIYVVNSPSSSYNPRSLNLSNINISNVLVENITQSRPVGFPTYPLISIFGVVGSESELNLENSLITNITFNNYINGSNIATNSIFTSIICANTGTPTARTNLTNVILKNYSIGSGFSDEIILSTYGGIVGCRSGTTNISTLINATNFNSTLYDYPIQLYENSPYLTGTQNANLLNTSFNINYDTYSTDINGNFTNSIIFNPFVLPSLNQQINPVNNYLNYSSINNFSLYYNASATINGNGVQLYNYSTSWTSISSSPIAGTFFIDSSLFGSNNTLGVFYPFQLNSTINSPSSGSQIGGFTTFNFSCTGDLPNYLADFYLDSSLTLMNIPAQNNTNILTNISGIGTNSRVFIRCFNQSLFSDSTEITLNPASGGGGDGGGEIPPTIQDALPTVEDHPPAQTDPQFYSNPQSGYPSQSSIANEIKEALPSLDLDILPFRCENTFQNLNIAQGEYFDKLSCDYRGILALYKKGSPAVNANMIILAGTVFMTILTSKKFDLVFLGSVLAMVFVLVTGLDFLLYSVTAISILVFGGRVNG